MLCTIKYKLPFHIIQASVTWYRDYNPGLSVHEQFFSPYMLHSNMNRLFTDNGVGSGFHPDLFHLQPHSFFNRLMLV